MPEIVRIGRGYVCFLLQLDFIAGRFKQLTADSDGVDPEDVSVAEPPAKKRRVHDDHCQCGCRAPMPVPQPPSQVQPPPPPTLLPVVCWLSDTRMLRFCSKIFLFVCFGAKQNPFRFGGVDSALLPFAGLADAVRPPQPKDGAALAAVSPPDRHQHETALSVDDDGRVGMPLRCLSLHLAVIFLIFDVDPRMLINLGPLRFSCVSLFLCVCVRVFSGSLSLSLMQMGILSQTLSNPVLSIDNPTAAVMVCAESPTLVAI